jgi:hypothetical protein
MGCDIKTENEIWADIIGFNGTYQVSSSGRVRSFAGWKSGELIMKQWKNSDGYMMVTLLGVKHSVHRLVALAFIKGVSKEVNHINGIKNDNHAGNLEWCTHSENGKHAYAIGLKNSNHCIKPVFILGKDNKPVVKFKSMSQAFRQIGVNRTSLTMACKGKRQTAGGYKWRYV